jgi:hypothetical protein
VLQPWEQGIGGSSTLDGFSFGQDAVIGIQKPIDGNADYCLSLEGLQLGSNETSKEFTRANVTDNFTGISLYYIVYNYNYGSNAYDYAVQLVDGSGKVVHSFYEATNKTMEWNENNKDKFDDATLSGLSIPSTADDGTHLNDGTYYIKVMSRPTGTAAWQECFDGDRYQLTAVISGDQLTVSVPIPDTVLPTSASFVVSGDLTQGHEQEVTASITGGATDYHGNVILGVDGTPVMGKVLDIPAGQTVKAHYTFIPTTAGPVKLSLHTGRNSQTGKVSGTQIGTDKTITISESDASNTQTLTIEPIIDNLSGGKSGSGI